MGMPLDKVKHAAFVVSVAVGTCFAVAGFIRAATYHYVSPEEENTRIMAKLTASGFTKVTLRETMADRDACAEFSRRFAALDRDGDVVMGLVCCVNSGGCEVKY